MIQTMVRRAQKEIRNLSEANRRLWESGNLWIVIDLLRKSAPAFIRLDGCWGRILKENVLSREGLHEVTLGEVPFFGKGAHLKLDPSGYVHVWSDARIPPIEEALHAAG